MKKLWANKFWRWVIIIVVVVSLSIWGRGQSGLTVEVATIATGDISKTTLSSGSIILPDTSSIRAPLTGQVSAVSVKEGDIVIKGQTLFNYREDLLLTAMRQAEAGYAQAKQARDLVSRSTPTVLQMNASQVALDAASAARDRAKDAYDAAPSDTLLATYQQADVAYQQARAALETLQRQSPTQVSIASADASVDAALAALRQTQSDWANRVVVSPMAGAVSFTDNQLGQKIAADMTTTTGQTVMSVAGSSDLRFLADMDESDVVRLSVGQDVEVTLDAFPGQTFAGKIAELPVQPITNVTGGTVFQVGVSLTSPPAELRVGLRGQVTLTLDTIKDVLAVPTTALVTKGAQTSVWLVKDGQAHQQTVELGLESALNAQVVSGLSAGDQVVVSTNIRDIKEGLAVTVQP